MAGPRPGSPDTIGAPRARTSHRPSHIRVAFTAPFAGYIRYIKLTMHEVASQVVVVARFIALVALLYGGPGAINRATTTIGALLDTFVKDH